MRGRTVLILLILVVGLVAFIELYEHELPSSEERNALEKLVLETDVGEVTAIDLVWEDKHVRLEREPLAEPETEVDETDFTWRLVEPLSAPADTDLVVSLLESLVALEKKRILEDAIPDQVGLNPPRLTVVLSAGDRQSVMLVGSEVPAGKSMIVSRGGASEIMVVDNDIWLELNRAPGDWRSRQILDVDQQSIARVVLERNGERVVMARQGPDFWLEAPVVDRAAGDLVSNLLATMASMQVVSFADEWPQPPADLGLDPPIGKVEIETGAGSGGLRLEWGNAVPGAQAQNYARVGEQVFSTEADLQQYFETTPKEWRSLELTSMETFQIDALAIAQQDEEPMSLRREGANWIRDEDEISFTAVSDLLYAIAGARAENLLAETEEDRLELAASDLVLDMVIEGEARQQRVSFHSFAQEGSRVRVDDREVVLLVGKDEFTEILAKVGLVRAARSIKTAVDEQHLLSGPELNPDQ